MEETSTWQQVASLLWSIFRVAFSSIPLSFRTAKAWLWRNKGQDPTGLSPPRGSITFYRGTVWHERRLPSLHKFSYTVRYALFNLDSPPSSFSSSSSHHSITASEARSLTGTTGPVYLLTIPTSVGYEQNPLSVYYCFNDDETCLSMCIAEVTNTPWGERVTFLFDPNGDVVAKPLHVSPFMDMLGVWEMHASTPERSLTIKINVQHPELGNYFTASLRANRVECSQKSFESFFWLMPHKTAVGIYWQALLLWWKGVCFQQHPKYVDGNAYRERTIRRDEEIPTKEHEYGQNKLNSVLNPCSQLVRKSRSKCTRSYTWHEAKWPWT